MAIRRSSLAAGAVLALALAAGSIAFQQAPAIAANGLLRPMRNAVVPPAPDGCGEVTLQGAGVALSGWRCHATAEPHANVVLLHGIADNRASWRAAISRLTRNGFNVIAYDSRANGKSEGTICTYGFLEKQDLRMVVDTLDDRPVVLVGASLGAAVAIQEAADDPRVAAVVAAETFSDLRTIATERAPRYLPPAIIRRAFTVAEQTGGFAVDEVSPVRAPRASTPTSS